MAYAFTNLLGTHLRRNVGDDRANGGFGCERVETSIALASKVVVALYFPGPPSRNVAPLAQLRLAYEGTLQEKRLEVICLPPHSQNSGFLECESQGLKLELADEFGIEDFPSLVFMDAGANVIDADGLLRLTRDPLLEAFPWPAPAELTPLLGPQLPPSDQRNSSLKRPLEAVALSPQLRRCLKRNDSDGLLGSIGALAGAASDAQSTATTAVQQMSTLSAASPPVRPRTREVRAFVEHSPSARGTHVSSLAETREWRKLKRKLLKKIPPNGMTVGWFGTAPAPRVDHSSFSK